MSKRAARETLAETKQIGMIEKIDRLCRYEPHVQSRPAGLRWRRARGPLGAVADGMALLCLAGKLSPNQPVHAQAGKENVRAAWCWVTAVDAPCTPDLYTELAKWRCDISSACAHVSQCAHVPQRTIRSNYCAQTHTN